MEQTASGVNSGSRRSGNPAQDRGDGRGDGREGGTGWSFAQARRAASRLRATPLAHQVLPTVRPRSELGLFRSRAPLPLQLFVAARDGLLAELGDGFALLRRPALSPPLTTGGRLLRLARLLDRRWDLMLFAAPALAGLTAAAACTPADPAGGRAAAAATLAWVAALLAGILARRLLSAARTRAPATAGSHWSVPLFHQPDPRRVEDLARQVTDLLTRLAQDGALAAAAPVILAGGVSTPEARSVLARSVLARPDLAVARGSDPSARPVTRPAGPVRPASLLPAGLAVLAVLLTACTVLLASHGSPACGPAACAAPAAAGATGASVASPSALYWMLLLADPAGLGPGQLAVALLAWLVSAVCAALAVAAYLARREEIAHRNQAGPACPHPHPRPRAALATARVLLLVVTDAERDAVLWAVRRHTDHPAVPDVSGERIIYDLGLVGGTEVLLAQAGEQGTVSAAGMLVTARAAIRQCCPDYVIQTGICYGLRPGQGQQIGDVIVARRVHHIDPRKVTDQPGQPVIQRGVNVGCSPVLLNRFQASQLTWPGPRMHFGTVLCSGVLVDSRTVVDKLRRDYPDAIAGEMESVAVYEAAAEAPKPDWIMVKAVADWGYGKTDHGQTEAAWNAADLVTHVIAMGSLRQWQSRLPLACAR